MTDNNYRLDGFGNTIQVAEIDINKKRKDLTSKLHKAHVSTELNIADSHYKGVYDLQGKCKADACETHFEIESSESFNAITAKAKNHAGYNTHYNAQFSVEQYIKLSKDQKKIINPEEKRTPAGPYSQRVSSLDRLKNW